VTPDELIQRAKLMGLDGICITEHNQLWSEEMLEKWRRKHNFLVLGGVEVDTDCGHVLVFGLHKSVMNVYFIQELRELVDEAGGVMIAAHPFRFVVSDYYNHDLSLEEACKRPVFQFVEAIEVYGNMSSITEGALAAQVKDQLKLGATAGSDAHAILQVGQCFTVFDSKIGNEQELVREIKQGRCQAAQRNSRFAAL
jgi:predicted metal-dependent phosphoesterase TrpH